MTRYSATIDGHEFTTESRHRVGALFAVKLNTGKWEPMIWSTDLCAARRDVQCRNANKRNRRITAQLKAAGEDHVVERRAVPAFPMHSSPSLVDRWWAR